MKNKKVLIAFLIVSLYFFIRIFISINSEIKDDYNKDTIRDEIVNVLKKDSKEKELVEKEFGIKSEEDITDAKLTEILDKSVKIKYVFLGVLSLGIALLITTVLFIPVFIIVSVRKKYHKYRLDNSQFKENKDYYRDLLKGYTPLELSYNNNYKLDDYALIATVLNMENKKILEYKDNKFYVKNDTSNLDEIEKYIIKNIPKEGVEKITKNRFDLYSYTIEACKNKKLIELGKISKKKLIRDIVVSVIIYVIILITWLKLEPFLENINMEYNPFISAISPVIVFGLFAFVHLFPIFLVIRYFILFVMTNVKNYKKTILGEEIDYKLAGLKNFIEDFSILSEREKEEVVIWDEYLIYSVMFNDNNKIIDEYKDKVKIML